MLRGAISLLLAISATAANSAAAVVADKNSLPASMAEALAYCQEACLEAPEGIWEFPEDRTFVLICKDSAQEGTYLLLLLQGADCSFRPGEICGRISSTAHKNKYRLSLCLKAPSSNLADMASCLAELDEKNSGFYIQPRRLNIKLRNIGFLSKFWRAVSIGIDDPSKKLPPGMRRVAPDSPASLPIYF